MERTIWKSEVDPAEWADYIEEELKENPDLTEDEVVAGIYEDLLPQYLADERYNLDITTETKILCIASLGRWNGRFNGYREFGNNVHNILTSSCDYVRWYCDDEDLKGEGRHHDGRDYYTYRLLKDDKDLHMVEDLIYNDKWTDELQERYTTSLRPLVAKVYGW